MKVWRVIGCRPARLPLVSACLGIVLGGALLFHGAVGASAEGGGQLVAEPVLGAAAAGVERLFGASPGEAPGEVWGVGGSRVIRYTDADEWQEMPPPVDAGGQPIPGLQFAPGPLAGRTTAAGGVLVGATSPTQRLLLRDPGGQFRAAPDPSLLTGETLFAASGETRVLAIPVDEPGGKTGAFLVPAVSGSEGGKARVQSSVLRFDGSSWQRESICLDSSAGTCLQKPQNGSGFKVLAIDASGPGNAWLLATGAVSGDGIELFSRQAGGEWRRRSLGGPLGALFAKKTAEPSPGVGVSVEARGGGQPLTVSPQGVWVDATLGSEKASATLFYDIASETVTGSWCDLQGAATAMRAFPLGSDLAGKGGRSFAWPGGGGPGEEFGTRTITGIGQGALLIFGGASFARIPLSGGEAGGALGAALSAPDAGWLASADGPLRLTRTPIRSGLEPWPVPFRRPLTAVAPQPGVPVGALGSQALAVGDEGEVVRYMPGQGWDPESLLTDSGSRAVPRLRAVAWPEPDQAYAVGDGGEMWIWRRATDLWEPDPGKPPNLVRGNFTGIAFDPSDPSRGYAVGKQGLLLGFGKRWTAEALPAGMDPEANITSIAFAGRQALATYKMPVNPGSGVLRYSGGLIVNDGTGWRVDEGLASLLGEDVPQRVAGLPDGGAVVASVDPVRGLRGRVFVRNDALSPWQETARPTGAFPVALNAIREGGQVRAVVSVERTSATGTADAEKASDSDQVFNRPAAGQPPLLTDPYPLARSGLLIRQTATGWRDEQRQAYPLTAASQTSGTRTVDLPLRPDPVLALLLSPDGSQGWAVGGETGEDVSSVAEQFRKPIQTAGVMRYGAGADPPTNASTVPIAPSAGVATFAIGGNAQCGGRCADLVATGIAPDVWLRAAVGRAATIPGVRAFVYSGSRLASQLGTTSRVAFGEEEAAYAARLAAAAGSLPVYAATAASDRDPSAQPLGSFATRFEGFGAPLGKAPAPAGVAPVSPLDADHGYYSFDSNGADGAVRVVVLDYSLPVLSVAQRTWLEEQLAAAKTVGEPAIVIGNRDLSGQAGTAASATDGAGTIRALVGGGASAYFFDFPEQNRTFRLSSGGRSIPAFGSGTLGYITPPSPRQTDFVGAAGFMLASVDVAARDEATNVAPVGVRLIPSIEDLALDATDGTLLRRSRPALFQALARRPRAGILCTGNFAPGTCETLRPDPYIKIPPQCRGARCQSGIFPEYRFSSSNPDVADFVKVDTASLNPRSVLLGRNDKPILDPTSGLLCAFNAGTTTVTIEAGGLAYSAPVRVQRGSVQRPCGTVPLRERAVAQPRPEAPPPPVEGEPPIESNQPSLPPPAAPAGAPTPGPAVTPKPVHAQPPLPALPLVPVTPLLTPIVPIVPPPPPPAAQTTPPSGTSPVTQPVTSPEDQREEEAAFDLVHHMAALGRPARRPAAQAWSRGSVVRHSVPVRGASPHRGPSPLAPLALAVLLAAGAAIAVGGSRRGRGPGLAYQDASNRIGR
jgi:hypothetical protein